MNSSTKTNSKSSALIMAPWGWQSLQRAARTDREPPVHTLDRLTNSAYERRIRPEMLDSFNPYSRRCPYASFQFAVRL